MCLAMNDVFSQPFAGTGSWGARPDYKKRQLKEMHNHNWDNVLIVKPLPSN